MTWNYFLSHCRILEHSLKTRRNLVCQSLRSSNQKREPRRDRTKDGELAQKDVEANDPEIMKELYQLGGELETVELEKQ